MAKDFTRLCKACGHSWLIAKALAREKAPSRLEIGSRKMMAAGSSATAFSRNRSSDQLRLQGAQAIRARVLANSQCPSCGSSNFVQGPAGSSQAARQAAKAKRKAERNKPAPSPLGDQTNRLRATVERDLARIRASQPPPPPSPATVDHLERLAALHAAGQLSDAEFTAAKAKLLAG